jgi:hypothetical protein
MKNSGPLPQRASPAKAGEGVLLTLAALHLALPMN